MAGIFINYRRDDNPGVAGRLFDYLALKYSRNGIFMDVDAMKPGMDFAEQLDSQVSQCRVLLAAIGPRWLDTRAMPATAGSADNWSLCQSACRAELQCLAWTSVHPGLQGPNARCWLKNKIPQATANPCCTSGIERAEVP